METQAFQGARWVLGSMRGWGWKKVDNGESWGTVGSWCEALGNSA